jgi:DNA-binding transcriptional MerR regulator
MKIGELARRSGVGIHAIRYFERCGLIGRAERLPGGYRVFDERDLSDLRFVVRLQALGFRNREIRELAQRVRDGRSPCDGVRAGLTQRLREVDALRAALDAYRRLLARLDAQWRRERRCACSAASPCVLLEDLSQYDKEVSRAQALARHFGGARLLAAGRAGVR